MNGSVPIPAYEQLFLPAPSWLLVVLSTFTLWVHLLLVGAVVGSAFILLLRLFTPRGLLDRQLDQRILKTMPVFISLAITFGVAPLLFTQALYGPYFYSSNIFLAPFWISSLVFLLIGFIFTYFAYLATKRLPALILRIITISSFLAILYIFTINAVLHVRPEYWLSYQRNLTALHLPNEPILLPRIFHNLGAAFVIAGIAIAWIGRFRSAADKIPSTAVNPQRRSVYATRVGLQWMIFGLLLQIVFGLWFLLSLPAEMQKELISFQSITSKAWWIALAFVAFNLLTAIKGVVNPLALRWLIFSTFLPAAGMIGMLMARQYLRTAYLSRPAAGSFDISQWHTRTQIEPMYMFFATLAVGLIVLLIMVIMVLTCRSALPPLAVEPSADQTSDSDSIDNHNKNLGEL